MLKHTVYGDIEQLIPSPRGEYLAIVTANTVHVGILPQSHHLSSPDPSPIKLRCFQVGPLDHVLEGSPLAAVVWHPLGHMKSCLVTVTTSAIVRLFELNRSDKRSFDTPTLAVDLKRLANATRRDDAVKQQTYRESIGFSPDLVEMEVVAAGFSNATTGWAPMTFWVAMKGGEVYALCPLLPPRRWQTSADHLKSISVLVTAQNEDGGSPQTEEEAAAAQMQIDWYSDLCEQEITLDFPHGNTTDPAPEQVFTCPPEPGSVPKLQGPFELEPGLDDGDVTDMLVMGLQASNPVLSDYDEFDVETDDYLPYSVICLLTSSRVHVCLDLDGVEARWLSNEKVRGSHRRRSYH